jgi:hypothetical protein
LDQPNPRAVEADLADLELAFEEREKPQAHIDSLRLHERLRPWGTI